MSRVPRIRFKGFEEDWEQRKLSDLYEKVIEKNDLSFGTDKIISVANMYYKEDTSNSDDDYMRTYNVMRLGDIAFEGNKSKNFAHGRFVENTIGDGIVSHVFDVFRPISEYDLLFWKYFINYEGVMGRIMIRCTKASTMMTNLVAKDFLEESIVVPGIVEQKRIGYYLESLDHLITLHQRKLEKLKIIKKSMLENLFPQNGEKTSKIRFSGFTKDWEQRKLGEVCNIITKQTGFDYSSTIKPALLKEKADNTYPFIQNKDFNGTTINMDTDFFIPISVAEKFPNIVLDRPSILISISGRIGNVGFYSCVHRAFIGGAVGICKLKYNDDGKFIIHELESEYGQKYFYSLIKASSHANITVEDIRNIELIFPNQKEEKVCISTFFSTLDHLITLHQSKLDKLRKIKKSILESMFV